MAQATTNDIRGGMKVEIEGQPYTVVSNEFFKPGKGRATNRIRVKHLVSGRTVEKVFTSGDKLDLADVEELSMRMLYKEEGGVVFMNDNSFEQIKILDDSISETSQWLLEDHLYDVVFWKGQPVTVQPPTFMDMIVTETAPGDRGNTASGRVLKPATLQSGAKVQIPIFVSEGEKIRIDTRTCEYVSRVSD